MKLCAWNVVGPGIHLCLTGNIIESVATVTITDGNNYFLNIFFKLL